MSTVTAFAFFLLTFAVSSPAFPAPEKISNVQTYDQLVHAIREARAASEKRVEQAVDQEKVREAWEIGKLIHEHILLHKERADYGKRILIRLAGDLEMSETELGYMLQFVHTYPISPPAGKLSWAHYRELLSLNDEEERREVATKAEKEGWGRDRVREEVRRRQAARNPSQEKAPEPVLTATPGKVGVYRVIRAKVGPFAGELALDLGFASYFQPDKINQFKEGDIVHTRPSLRGSASNKAEAISVLKNASLSDLYTYRAYVSEVLDGDTFKAVIDLGFDFVTEQKLRLRGLDAPEIESKDGKEAKAFLERILKKNNGPVLIKTVKSDKYDRYLADVWVGETYLNQKLIDAGLAVRVSE